MLLTHESRGASRARSLQELARAGITPDVLISHNEHAPADADVRLQAYNALSIAYAYESSLVFFEDDIQVRPDLLTRHITLAEEAGVITVFCGVNARLYPPGTLNEPALPVRLAPIPNYDADRGFHGSMAIYVPVPVVEYGVAHPGQFHAEDGGHLTNPTIEPDRLRGKVTGFDFWLKSVARRFGGMLMALPNSVNHASRHGTWPSLTFHTPTAKGGAG